MVKITTQSAAETHALAYDFAAGLRGGDVVALEGQLGSGKTTFAAGLAKGLRLKSKIKSPTFVLTHPHPIPKTKRTFYHFDLYRLRSPQDLADLGFSEILKSRDHITVIEWPAVAKKFLPPQTIYIRFHHVKSHPNHRTVIFT